MNLGSRVFSLLFSNFLSYSLYKNTSLFWITLSHCFSLSRLVDCISFSFPPWYASWIYCMCFLTCVPSFSLYLSNFPVNSFWIWYICFSISLCMIPYSLLAILYTSSPICSLCVLLAYNNVVSISASLIFATFASLIRSCIYNYRSAILSSP